MIGVYLITNKINGKMYVGSSIDIDRRWKEHLRDLFNGNHHAIYLQRSFNKYGNNFKFEIIHETIDVNNLLIDEQYYIDVLKPEYNSHKTAGSPRGYKHSERAKEKISKSLIGNNRALGNELSEKTRNKMSEAKKGKKFTKEHTQKIVKNLHNKEVRNKANNSCKKAIMQLSLNNEFIKNWPSATDIQNELGISKSDICACCKGRQKTAKGFKWIYEN